MSDPCVWYQQKMFFQRLRAAQSQMLDTNNLNLKLPKQTRMSLAFVFASDVVSSEIPDFRCAERM